MSEKAPQASASTESEAAHSNPHEHTRNVGRDYWVALSEHAGVLWIYQVRLARGEDAWFLHGTFA